MKSPESLQIGMILMGLLGGLALFLYGMEQMTLALKGAAGGGMKRMLARMTNNRFKSLFTGAFVTVVIQSSSVTTVLLIGFISAGLMTLSQSIGVIMGANIGTTITAQLIAFKITDFALIPVFIGFTMTFFFKQERTRRLGTMLLGFGLLLYGMSLMGSATRPLRTYQPFIDLMKQMSNPLYGIFLSALFTGVIQSSSATTGVIIVLAAQGFISLEGGIALLLGANIGTCITAILAAIGKSREAFQAAVIHILFNVVGVLGWVFFIGYLASLVRWISPASTGLQGAARLAAETPRQIANAHTIFNLLNAFVFIWFVGPFAWLVDRITPRSASKKDEGIQPKYLDDLLLDTPTLALDRVRMEMRRVGERAHDMVERSLSTVLHGTEETLEKLAHRDDEVDTLHSNIVSYLGKLLKEDLQEAQSQQLRYYMSVANQIESIGDLVEVNLVSAGHTRLRTNVQVSTPTEDLLQQLHEEACRALQLALESFDAADAEMAKLVIERKPLINELADQAERHLAHRLSAEEDNRIAHFRVESELIDYFKRVFYFAKRIAKGTLEWKTLSAPSKTPAP